MFLNKSTTKELIKKYAAKEEIELKLSSKIENENFINKSKKII